MSPTHKTVLIMVTYFAISIVLLLLTGCDLASPGFMFAELIWTILAMAAIYEERPLR